MTFQTWWLFVVAVFLLCGTPGPNMLHILSRSVEMGLKRSFFAMAGCLTALVLVLTASAAGLTTLLLALPGVFEVLRYLGVDYLIYLGVKAWRSDAAPVDVGGEGVLSPRQSVGRLFRGGFTIGVSNPKLILFAAAFLPQFVHAGAPKAPQFAILVITFALVEAFWYLAYAFGGHSLSRYLAIPKLRRIFNRIAGGIFVAFGLALLKIKPS